VSIAKNHQNAGLLTFPEDWYKIPGTTFSLLVNRLLFIQTIFLFISAIQQLSFSFYLATGYFITHFVNE
jgi:hypothetical protein